MIEPIYRWEIALAGLLHDIGKLYQKSEEDLIGRVKISHVAIEHTLIAKEFIEAHRNIFEQAFTDDEIRFITECAVRHHSNGYGNANENMFLTTKADDKYKRYCNIINIADNISSSERSDTYSANAMQSHKENASLESPFARILSDKTSDILEYKLFTNAYSLDKWDNQRFMQKNIGRYHKPSDMNNHIRNFDKEVDLVKAQDKESLFNCLNKIIQNYTWCIPSDAKEVIRDVSLYQHLITTSAIATAIYNDAVKCSVNEQFTLKSIDNKKSDIILMHLKMDKAEDYILNTKSEGFDTLEEIHNKNCSLIDLYEKTIQSILNDFWLTKANVVISGGYESYILITKQYTEDVISKIKEINEVLLDEYSGSIYISYKKSDLTFEKTGEYIRNYELDRMCPILTNEPKYWTNGLTEIFIQNNSWNTSKMILTNEYKDHSKTEASYGTNNPDYLEFKDFLDEIRKVNNKITIITIDGDNVINTMKNGFITNDKDYGTISRLCTYSGILSNFFNEYIKANFSDIAYIININANRSILICEQSKALNLIKDLLDSYYSYTDNKMTLSVNSETVNISLRISDFITNCENNLKRCKSLGGDRIMLGSNILTYDELVQYSDLKNDILDDLENGVDQAVFNRLSKYSEMYNKYISTGDTTYLRCIPLYTKNKHRDNKDLNPEIVKMLNSAFDSAFKGKDDDSNILILLKDIIYEAQLEYRTWRNA